MFGTLRHKIGGFKLESQPNFNMARNRPNEGHVRGYHVIHVWNSGYVIVASTI